MSCPMTKDVPLTDEEIAKFCNLGCSVDCDKFLAEYIEKRDGKKMQDTHQNVQAIPECCIQCYNFYDASIRCSLGLMFPLKKQSCKRMARKRQGINDAGVYIKFLTFELPEVKRKFKAEIFIAYDDSDKKYRYGFNYQTRNSAGGSYPSVYDTPCELRDECIVAALKRIFGMPGWEPYRKVILNSEYGSYLYGIQQSLF